MTIIYFNLLKRRFAWMLFEKVICGTIDGIGNRITPNVYRKQCGLTKENQNKGQFKGWKYKEPGKIEILLDKYYCKTVGRIESKGFSWMVSHIGSSGL